MKTIHEQKTINTKTNKNQSNKVMDVYIVVATRQVRVGHEGGGDGDEHRGLFETIRGGEDIEAEDSRQGAVHKKGRIDVQLDTRYTGDGERGIERERDVGERGCVEVEGGDLIDGIEDETGRVLRVDLNMARKRLNRLL